MDNNAPDWRTQLQDGSRQRIVNKIIESLKKHLPVSGHEGMQELMKIAERFEERIYTSGTTTSQSDYLRKISMKMLTMETKTQNVGVPNSNASGSNQNLPDTASHSMQTQVRNQGQPPVPLPNQSQGRQQLLSQSMQNTIAPAGVQSSSGLMSALPSVTGLSQPSMLNTVSQSSNLQGILGISQNSVSNNAGQGIPSNILASSQKQMQGRPHPHQVVSQQHQQQSSKPQHYMYQQQQMQQQMLKQNVQQGNMQPSLMQSHIQQHPTQLQSSQQSLVEISSGGLQPSQSTLQQTQPSLMQPSSQQTSVLRQQQSQQNQLVGQQQSNGTNVQQNHLIGKQNIVSDLQLQQQQRLNSLSSMQQQQLAGQHNSISILQQQLGSQNSGGDSRLQQQQQHRHGTQSGVSIQAGNSGFDKNTQHQQSMHMLQQQGKGAGQQQQAPQTSSTLLQPLQGQQQSQSQMVSQLQPSQIQQQLGLQQQSNSLHRDVQQRPSMQTQSVIDQKPVFHSQRVLPEASSTSIDSTAQTGHASGADWQEETYQKIKTMKDMYLPDLSDMHHKISISFQQSENLQAPKGQIEQLRVFKSMLERMVQFLQLSKHQIRLSYREKINQIEKQIVGILTTHRPKKPNSLQLQQQNQQQLPPPNDLQMNLQQENQTNPQMQTTNLQANMMNSLQTGSMLESGQGNTMGSLNQGGMGFLQQNAVGASQQANTNTLSQSNVNVNPLQLISGSLQHHHLKQQQEQQQFLQSQLVKQQLQQSQVHQQLLPQQKQQMIMAQQQQQQPYKAQSHQIPQSHQMNEDLKVRQQGMGGFKPGKSQQQRLIHHHQQPRASSQFPISSPQLQSQSPQISQHSSPLIDQQNLIPSLTKAGSPLQYVNSPFVVPSPSTPLASSPLLGDPEKQVPSVSSLSYVGNLGQTHAISSPGQPQSLAIGTPGISASPLLAEITSLDRTASAMVLGKSTVSEKPMDRLLNAVKSMSTTSLGAAASDIQSFISLSDRVAGSASGNGSRAAIGEDLVAVTKSRMELKNASTQDGNSARKKMRREMSVTPLNAALSAGSVDILEALDSESTSTSMMGRPKVEANPALMDEINETNQRLIDTVVTVSDEDIDPTAAEGGEGIVVKCSFVSVSRGPSLKARYNSAQMSQIQPLRLLVPTNYPKSSPSILDKFPVELSNNSEDLSANTTLKFSRSLCCLSQPMSLTEMVKTWDKCAREVEVEYACKHGGGNFSSTYGTWKSCVGLP